MFSLRKFFKLGSTSYLDLAKHTYHDFVDHDCSEHAAAMAYYFLFALFPFLLFVTTLIGVLPIPHLLDYMMQYAQKFLPTDAFNLLKDNIRSLFMGKKQGLLSLGIVLALWSSSNAIVSVMDAMNKLYEVKEGRPFWKVRLTAVFLVVTLSLVFLLALILIMFGTTIGTWITDWLMFGDVFRIGWNIALVPVVLFLLILAVAMVYYFTPDVKQTWKWISPGAVIAIPSWIVMSLLFSYYINNFGSYNKTYGSIGAVIVLLLWLYLSGLIILFGSVMNSVIEHSSVEGKEPGEKEAGEKAEAPGKERAWFFRTFGKKEHHDQDDWREGSDRMKPAH